MKTIQFLKVVAILAIILCVALPRTPAGASEKKDLPSFSIFENGGMDGPSNIITSVSAPGVLDFPVVQQPENNPSSVTDNPDEVTQFGMADKNNVIGLLAHNTLAGEAFSNLRIGQEIRISYGNSRVDHFIVNHLARFKVMFLGSKDMHYLDLGTYKLYTTQELFSMFYQGNSHVTFQTCIEMEGDNSWGRLFITAIPIPDLYFRELKTLNLPERESNLAIIHSLELLNLNVISW